MVSREKCIVNYDKLLGRGAQGSIYEVCCNDCDYVVRIIIKGDTSESEIEISLIASENNIGPKIYEIWEENDKIFILMEKLIPIMDSDDFYLDTEYVVPPLEQRNHVIKRFIDANGMKPSEENISRMLEPYKKTYEKFLYAAVIYNNPKFRTELIEKLSKLNNLGYIHGDFHIGNIMLNKKSEPVIIDYGNAEFISEKNIYKRFYDTDLLEILFEFFTNGFPYIKY